jgi:hypothetical protein
VDQHDREVGDPAEDVVATLSAQGLWQAIAGELKNEGERVLVYCAYVAQMKPAEITAAHPRLFPSADDVYRVKRNVLERLRRNTSLLRSVGVRSPLDGQSNGHGRGGGKRSA